MLVANAQDGPMKPVDADEAVRPRASKVRKCGVEQVVLPPDALDAPACASKLELRQEIPETIFNEAGECADVLLHR